ncbi:MAG TPA: STAS/SEC14 domain-containing protein [Labilithrix sp.]|jgi:hypothetical protein|nr:STAS/SEC14 domain-containing protein [Labilithrix sp.]
MRQLAKSEHVELWYEPNTDILCTVLVGKLEVSDAHLLMQKTREILAEIRPRPEPWYVLVDIRQAGSLTPEVREAFADAEDTSLETRALQNARRMAIFGGSFAFRTVAGLIMKALHLVQSAPFSSADSDHRGVRWTIEADEATARAWLLERQRADVARKAAPT